MIHSTAIISETAKIGTNVTVGPYSVIGDGVILENDVEIMSHVCITGNTIVGSGTKIFPFATLGYCPQDLKFKGEKSKLIIGRNNSIREYVTMHPGTEGGIMKTVVGDGNLFMIGVHIAHDCIIGNNIIMGNNATLGGHVKIGDSVIIGGMSAIHQWVRVGNHAIIGGMSGVDRDVIPYGSVKGERAKLYGINVIGLQRAEEKRSEIIALRKAFDMIFLSENPLLENLKSAEAKFSDSKCVREIAAFMHQETNRSFCLPKESKVR